MRATSPLQPNGVESLARPEDQKLTWLSQYKAAGPGSRYAPVPPTYSVEKDSFKDRKDVQETNTSKKSGNK